MSLALNIKLEKQHFTPREYPMLVLSLWSKAECKKTSNWKYINGPVPSTQETISKIKFHSRKYPQLVPLFKDLSMHER